MEPELECFNAQTRKGDDYGELKGGFVSKCSLGFCRTYVYSFFPSHWVYNEVTRLLDPNFYLLPLLGSRFPLEVIVGVNGKVWFKCADVWQTAALARCLEAADPLGGAMSQEDVVKLLGSMDI
jgi:exosome complex component RRP40